MMMWFEEFKNFAGNMELVVLDRRLHLKNVSSRLTSIKIRYQEVICSLQKKGRAVDVSAKPQFLKPDGGSEKILNLFSKTSRNNREFVERW